MVKKSAEKFSEPFPLSPLPLYLSPILVYTQKKEENRERAKPALAIARAAPPHNEIIPKIIDFQTRTEAKRESKSVKNAQKCCRKNQALFSRLKVYGHAE